MVSVGLKKSMFLLLATHSSLCGAKAHYMVKHNKNEFAYSRNHINEIVNF
ncbi:hypothetical protein [Campylobacter troglodytis]|nr:hypothetical protein [Campylobacter troglodytis]